MRFDWLTPPVAVALARVVLGTIVIGASYAEIRAEPDAAFFWFAALAGIWAVLALALAVLRPQLARRLVPLAGVIDLALLGALTYASGGAVSEARRAYVILPLIAALLFGPRATGVWTAASGLTYVGVSLAHSSTTPSYYEEIVVQAAYLAGVGLISVLVSATIAAFRARAQEHARALVARARESEALATEKAELAQQILEVSAAERERLAFALHDQAVPEVIMARRELGEAVRGRQEAVFSAWKAIERAEEVLREITGDLHSHELEHLGLSEALEGLLRRPSVAGSLAVDLYVGPGGYEEHETVIYDVVKELATNASRHSGGRNLWVRVEQITGSVRITISDDGQGIDADRLGEAIRRGHFGVSGVAAKVRGAGGSVEWKEREPGGTEVLASLPNEQPEAG